MAILKVLTLPKFHDAMGLTKPLRRENVPEDLPEWATQEMEVLKTAYRFATCLAEHVLWSNAKYWWSLPELLATMLHKDRRQRKAGMEQMEAIVSAVVAAEGHSSDQEEWKDLLKDLGWNKQQLARTAMALLVQSGFEESRGSELVKLSRRLFTGSPSTKDTLENTFAFLHRKAQVHSTNMKMSDACKYAYAILSPYAETGGCPQILPSEGDCTTILAKQGQTTRDWLNKHLFSPQKSLFPSEGKRPVQSAGEIFNSKWRSAGVASQQRSTAAAVYLVADMGNNFSNVDSTWVSRWAELSLFSLRFSFFCFSSPSPRRVLCDRQRLLQLANRRVRACPREPEVGYRWLCSAASWN